MEDGKEDIWRNVKVGDKRRDYKVKCWKSDDDKHRYKLKISLINSTSTKEILVIMINPSYAYEKKPDYTCRALINLCDFNKYNSITICNLFSLIKSNMENLNEPRKMNIANDKLSDDKLEECIECIKNFNEILCAWGSAEKIKDRSFYNDRIRKVYNDMLKGKNLKKFGDEVSFKGKTYPTHPRRYYIIKSKNELKTKFKPYELGDNF